VCLVLHTAGSVTPGLAAAGFALVTAAVRSRRFPRQPRRWLQGYL
jgi:uncharacterized membrane protein YbaN (DUF454 family)